MDIFLITGGSRGLGNSLVRHLQTLDANVVSLSRSLPSGACAHTPADLSDPWEASAAVTSALKTLDLSGAASVNLINNAGTLSPIGPADEADPAEILANTGVNFVSPIVLISAFLKALKTFRKPKRLATVTSGAAFKTYDGWSLYCASKAGLEHFTRCVAEEQKRLDPDVTLINFNPGVMDTAMQQVIRETPEERFPSRPRFVSLHNARELSDPDHVARCLIRGLLSTGIVSGETYTLADFEAITPDIS